MLVDARLRGRRYAHCFSRRKEVVVVAVAKSRNDASAGRQMVERLLKLGATFDYWDHGYDFPHRTRQVFQDVSLENKNLLEIGSGNGLFSIWASLNGAKTVVALEPLAEGSGSFEQTKIYSEFAHLVASLNLENISMLPNRIQDYAPGGEGFDIVLSIASVNHLDEESCIELQKSSVARANYRELFKLIADRMNDGGTFILMDCSSRNFFGDLGITNPMEKSIEWFKHQPPEFWCGLLLESGFVAPRISWPSGRYLRYLRQYRRTRLWSYFLDSVFRIEVTCSKS